MAAGTMCIFMCKLIIKSYGRLIEPAFARQRQPVCRSLHEEVQKAASYLSALGWTLISVIPALVPELVSLLVSLRPEFDYQNVVFFCFGAAFPVRLTLSAEYMTFSLIKVAWYFHTVFKWL